MSVQLWQPWAVHNNRIILTGEPMPDKGTVLVGECVEVPMPVSEWPATALECGARECTREVFRPLDIFAPHDGPVYNQHGNLTNLTHADLLRTFFRDLDQRPNVQVLCVTAYPELVPQSWPADVETVVRALQGKGDVTHAKLSNLTILAGPIRCQADLERLAPVMRGLRDLCRVGLWFDGQEAGLDVLRQAADFWETAKHYRREIAYSSILLTSPNQHTADVERQVEGSGVEVIRL